jgi:flagellin
VALVVNTNLSSLQTQYYLNQSQSALNNALTQLSSGLRINSAADDAAGYAIASGLTSQVNGLTVASQNANNAISLSQTAEGALQQITTNLQRIRELAVESANATNSSEDRTALNAEAQQLISEVNREAGTTQFNGVNLLDGSFQSQNFQVGANAGQTITVGSSDGFIDARSSALGQTYAATNTFVNTAITTSSDANYASTFTGISATTTSGTTTLTTGLAKGALSVNGISIGKGLTDGISYVDSKGSAIAVANAINSAGIPNLTATANAVVATSTITASSSYSGSLTNSQTVSVTAGSATASNTGSITATGGNALRINGISITGKFNNLQGLEALINTKTSQTGVIASTGSNGGLELTGVDGRNITVMDGAGVTGINNAGGLSAGQVTLIGTVSLSTSATTAADAKITVTDNSTNNKYFGATAINQSASTQTTSIDALDISTVTGATNALTAIDSALSALNSASANLGAVQNRFQSVVDSLASLNQSDTAALSTIQDADFAAQTAAYTRAQVLQSAGQSMLAQANSNPQRVLQLLQNL